MIHSIWQKNSAILSLLKILYLQKKYLNDSSKKIVWKTKIACFMLNFLNLKSKPIHLFFEKHLASAYCKWLATLAKKKNQINHQTYFNTEARMHLWWFPYGSSSLTKRCKFSSCKLHFCLLGWKYYLFKKGTTSFKFPIIINYIFV